MTSYDTIDEKYKEMATKEKYNKLAYDLAHHIYKLKSCLTSFDSINMPSVLKEQIKNLQDDGMDAVIEVSAKTIAEYKILQMAEKNVALHYMRWILNF